MKIPLLSTWWGRLALRAKMVLVAGVPLVVLGAAIPVTYLSAKAEERLGRTVVEVFELRQSLGLVLQDLVDGETGARGYLLTNDPRFLQPYRLGAGSARGDFVRMRTRLQAVDPAAVTRLDALSALIDRRLELLRRLVVVADRSPGSVPDDLLSQGKRTMDEIRAVIAALDAAQAGRLEIAEEDLASARSTSLLVSVGLVPVALLLTIFVVVVFANTLVRRVKRIERNARRLESGGSLDPPEPGSDEIARLDVTLQHAAARIFEQDAELRELALVDPLTDLHNRRGFLEIAEHELQVCLRRGSATALLFIDVDGLKLVNDRLGHAAGDRLLRDVADVLRSSTRESDLLARVGGDEFCVLLTRDSAVDGAVLLDRLQTTLEVWNTRPDVPYEVAFSVGVGLFDPAEPVPVGELVEQADRAMYENKRARAAVRAGV